MREAEKKEVMEPLHSQMADGQTMPKVMSFIPLQKLTGTQPVKTPAVQVAHVEQDGADKEESAKSDNPKGIKGMTEEFIVHLARAVKEAQKGEKCCYHCSSLEHFIHKCPLVKASWTATHLNQKEGMAPEKGAWTPQVKMAKLRVPPGGGTQDIGCHTQTPILNPNPFNQWYGIKNVAKVRVNTESCMALLDNGVKNKHHHTTFCWKPFFRGRTPLRPSWWMSHLCGSGKYTYWLVGYIIIQIQVDRVQGYEKDQIALVILDLSNFVAQVPAILGIPTISCIINVIKEKEIDAWATPWVNAWVAYLLAVQ